MAALYVVWLVEEQVAVGAWRGWWFTKTQAFENRTTAPRGRGRKAWPYWFVPQQLAEASPPGSADTDG